MLGVRFCARALSSCGKRGPLFIALRGPLTIAASLVAEHRLQTRRLSSCGTWAQLLRGTRDLPRPGLETRVPCIGRQILNHCATREAPLFLKRIKFCHFCPGISGLKRTQRPSRCILGTKPALGWPFPSTTQIPALQKEPEMGSPLSLEVTPALAVMVELRPHSETDRLPPTPCPHVFLFYPLDLNRINLIGFAH